MNLSTHFTLAELTVTEHRNIDNTAPGSVVEALTRTARGLEGLRTLLGAPVIVSSGYRCPALNKAVGGQPNSQHMLGEAADIICPGFGAPSVVASRLIDSGIDYDQLILEFDRWVHISFSAHPRHQALIIDHTGTRPMRGAA